MFTINKRLQLTIRICLLSLVLGPFAFSAQSAEKTAENKRDETLAKKEESMVTAIKKPVVNKTGDDDDIDDLIVERNTERAKAGDPAPETEDDLYVGAKPDVLVKTPPLKTITTPNKLNCGTFWTGWTDSVNDSSNPCPANCERGEVLDKKEYKAGDITQYNFQFQCNQKLELKKPPTRWSSTPMATLSPSTGAWGSYVKITGEGVGKVEGVTVRWHPNDDDHEKPLMEQAATISARKGDNEITIQIPNNPSISGWSSEIKSGVVRVYLRLPNRLQPDFAGKFLLGTNVARRVTDTPSGQHLASEVQGTSTSGIDSSLAATRFNASEFAGTELSTRNIEGAPTSILSISNLTATSLTIKWKTVNGASSYSLHAAASGLNHAVNGMAINAPAGSMNDLSGSLVGLAPGVEHEVWVSIRYPDGKIGRSDIKKINTPAPENPKGFVARKNGNGAVFLGWEARANSTHYLVEGSHLPRTETTETGIFINDLPPGVHQWTLIAVYPPGIYNVLNPSRVSFEVEPYPYWGGSGKARYRVTLNGFRVHQETFDNPLQLDGKGDEIYLFVHVDERERSTHIRRSHAFVKSPVFGDRLGINDMSRVKAGSAGDHGGLRRGDTYPSVNPENKNRPPSAIDLPLLVWEGELESNNNYVLINPSIWEWDGNAAISATWQAIRSNYNDPNVSFQREKALIESKFLATKLEALTFVNTDMPYLASFDRLIGLHETRQDPVTKRNDSYDDRGLVLTHESVESELMRTVQPGSLPVGIIPIRYQDLPQLGHQFGGDYTLYLQVERLP